ncbi:MAG: FHA domain-containing protein, partial [Merismopedia sp. SIO2A8]|nr:FHA domain-containing protein [Merismopedia sp. SIO2A8]
DNLLCFLKHNPSLSSSLFSDLSQNIQDVTTIIEPVLAASKRCQNTRYYIQAVSIGHTGFLATNLNLQDREGIRATATASSWSVGRGSTCALHMPDQSVSRCHAVITHHAYAGFFLTDLGSKNGTWVNGTRVISHSRQPLNDGDLIQLGMLKVELFVSDPQQDSTPAAAVSRSCMTTSPN